MYTFLIEFYTTSENTYQSVCMFTYAIVFVLLGACSLVSLSRLVLDRLPAGLGQQVIPGCEITENTTRKSLDSGYSSL